LVTIDTLRRDHLGYYGYARDTSPFIDRLAKNGLVFKNTAVPLPLTDPSHASILTGLHPLVHGLLNNAESLSAGVETIAETLKKNGYYTIGAVSVYHLSKKYNFSQGFDSYSDRWDQNIRHNLDWQRVAESTNKSLFQQVNSYLNRHPRKPLFIWVHYYDPHIPYINWPQIRLSGKPPKIKQIEYYDKDIRYTDNAVKALYGYLEEKGLTRKLITCITADHGEQLGEHGAFAGHYDFYSETSFVPLLFHGPGIPKHKVVNRYVSTLDIAPTLLAIAGLEFTAPVQGKNLLDDDREPNLPADSRRDYLVIGNPRLVRSLQHIREPYSYILNNDHLYKYWYVSDRVRFPDDRLETVKQKHLELEYLEKSDKYRITVRYPYTVRRGLHYGVLRFDVKKDRGYNIGYQIGSGVHTAFAFKNKQDRTVTAYFPVTELDLFAAVIYKKKETEIVNLRYALVPAQEMEQYFAPETRLENLIYKTLNTPRTRHPGDELYHLDSDFKMRRNLLGKNKKRELPRLVRARTFIYRRLKQLLDARQNIPGSRGRKKPLSDKEKEMLKSLGYL
jgi:hypothetical protein